MKSVILNTLFVSAILLSVSSCRKADLPQPTPPDTTKKEGSVKFELFNQVGSSDMNMSGTWYKNENGDSFQITTFNYYLSNIKLNKADGSSYAEPESYHLVQQSDASSRNFSISNVPAGTYSSVTFTIGVDSLRNVSGAQTGALDPANGMFWSWTTGYIMFKIEGVSPQSTQSGNIFMLHAGGFKGENNVLRTITLNFPNAITVNGDVNHIHLTANAQKALGSPNPISFATTSVIMSAGANAKALADNYQNMFSINFAGK